MRTVNIVSDSQDFVCPECGGDLVENSYKSKTVHCTMCCQVFNARDMIAVETVYVMEDEDEVKDDSGIGHELRDLLERM